MDNACLLSPVKADVLETQVKQWQAWQEERRMPEVSLHRRRRAPALAKLRAELSPLEGPLHERMAADMSDRNSPKRDLAGTGLVTGLNLPWHLGFYSEDVSGGPPSAAYTSLSQSQGRYYLEQLMGIMRGEGGGVALTAGALTALALILLGVGHLRKRRVKAVPGRDGASLPPLLRTVWAKRPQGRG